MLRENSRYSFLRRGVRELLCLVEVGEGGGRGREVCRRFFLF